MTSMESSSVGGGGRFNVPSVPSMASGSTDHYMDTQQQANIPQHLPGKHVQTCGVGVSI